MISLLDNVVIFATVIAIPIILRLIISRHLAQQALRWWYQRQHLRMCQEAELIRNKMLQELFVLRRHIELSRLSCSESKFDEKNLDRIQKIHSSLIDLSEYFYPAHLDDGLPLAIRAFVESRQSHLFNLNIQLDLPETWNQGSEEINRILLMLLHEAIEIINDHNASYSSILLSLKQEKRYSELRLKISSTVKFNHHDYSALQTLNYLSHIFKTLTGGKSGYQQNEFSQIWYFYW
ncbi:hypothetical protein WA1_04100 [Scytonema hofmannii PCC 7110]|uniref:Uncharacterized protein n=1 Tax=Scytonema hofmannii PCC 7110 TaxID=128403 RepID=A0A139WZ49_9CYAN|nr:hypothetical protein [Scytonema hofmannii]KYC37708.1 hypothetical protein WA1_04100 [Scytonema hofmannii PCC 7110]